MASKVPSFLDTIPSMRGGVLLFLTASVVGACATGPAELPDPRPIVIRSGARLHPEKERLTEINDWYQPQMENIEQDPSFMIMTVDRDTPGYPWESMLIEGDRFREGDTVRIGVEVGKSPEAGTAYTVYAHYHIMKDMSRIEEFLSGGDRMEGFDLERAILDRVSDVWLLGRSTFGAQAYGPLEELLYSNEEGYLNAFILTARGEEFEEERQAWLREDPEALESYRSWFVDTFSREPPGLREEG